MLVSAALSAFYLVLYGLGLVSDGLTVFCSFVFCAGLGCSHCVLFAFVWFWAGLCQFRCFAKFYIVCREEHKNNTRFLTLGARKTFEMGSQTHDQIDKDATLDHLSSLNH